MSEKPPRRRRETAPLLFPSADALDPMRRKLVEVLAFVEAVARCTSDDDPTDRDRLTGAVRELRRVLVTWDAAGPVRARGQDLSDRWLDVRALSDACVTVAAVAAHRRGESVGPQLRDAAFFLADVAPDRIELMPAAIHLAWAAGAATMYQAPACYHDVLDRILIGIGMAATLADLDHPALLQAWRAAPDVGLD